MPNTIKSLVCTSVLAAAVIAPALAQDGLADVGTQMARLAGAMHATARACGEASDSELAALKQQQKAQHGQFGMVPATFDSGFDAGEKEVDQRIRAMSPAQKVEACTEIKQQMKELGSQLGQMHGQ